MLKLDLDLSHEHAVIWLAREVRDTIRGAVVLAFRFIQLHTEPLPSCELGNANEAHRPNFSRRFHSLPDNNAHAC